MKSIRIVSIFLCLFWFGRNLFAASVVAAPVQPVSWFQKTTQALYDAVAPGDKFIWRRTLADNCVITDEDGRVFNKTRFLKTLKPLPPGFSGRIQVQGLTVHNLGVAAVVHYWLDEKEKIFGQTLRTRYVETDTYRREGDSWKMVTAQITVVPRDLTPVKVDKRGWPALVGNYELGKNSNWYYHVFMHKGSLYGGRNEKSATLLIPLSPQVFFQKGSIHVMVFVLNPLGTVTEVLELHKYNEVAMQRIAKATR